MKCLFKNFIFIIVFLSGSFLVKASQLSCDSLTISIVTCERGNEIYSLFGHTALRIKSSCSDIVYNYGTFDFNEPNFLLKFLKGDLNYSLSESTYNDFISSYLFEKRGVREQILNLTQQEARAIEREVKNTLVTRQKRYYKYDFTRNNCSTKIRDLIFSNLREIDVSIDTSIRISTSRDALHSYLESGHKYWEILGLDILLGYNVDNKLNFNDEMFLPEFVSRDLNSILINDRFSLINSTRQSVPYYSTIVSKYLRPIYAFSIFSIFLISLFYSNGNFSKKIFNILTNSITFTSGLLGWIILILILFSSHQQFKNNINILWACPLNIFLPFINKRTLISSLLITISAILIFCYFILAIFGVQDINPTFFLIVFCLCLYYISNSSEILKSFEKYKLLRGRLKNRR